MEIYEVYALKYAQRNERTRADSFLFDLHPHQQHDMDYYIWVIKNDQRLFIVDTGYDRNESKIRDRPIIAEPIEVLDQFGISAKRVTDVIITHLHYDHAGSLDQFPNAKFHLQSAEMAYATGPCMCHKALRHPYSLSHVSSMLEKVYSGRVVFYDGDAALAPGIDILSMGGHSRGLQALKIATASGPLLLASDASHYYENVIGEKLFPIVENAQVMLDGFTRMKQEVDALSRIIPGHDPLVRQLYPLVTGSNEDGMAGIYRLDVTAHDFDFSTLKS